MQVCGILSSTAETLITVTLLVNDDTAQQNNDFTLSVLALEFQLGEVQSCTIVSAIADFTLEEDEMFSLGLQSVNNLVQISSTDGEAIVMIPNQDCKL